MRHHRHLAALTAAVLLAAACSNQSDDTESTSAPTVTGSPVTTATAESTAPPTTASGGDETTAAATTTAEATTSTAAEPAKPMFGTMESPCGPGDATIAEGQNGGDTLKLGVANDHGSDIQPGTNQEMLDAGLAFAEWCNAQGGVLGIPIEIIDLDGKLLSVPPAMEQACAEAFAMVGGGWTFDDQMFPRFHECKMISFSGFTVTAQAAKANGKIQPIPNPPDVKPSGWWEWAKATYPDAVQRTAIFYGDFQTTITVADELEATMNQIGGFNVVLRQPYAIAGESNWSPFAQALKDNNVGVLTFVGTPPNLINLAKAMQEVGYVPELVLQEVNFYDDLMVAPGLETITSGFMARTSYAPLQEPDTHPGIASYLEMMETYLPNGKIAGLGIQSTSAFLMFVTAANMCAENNDNVLERECILAAGKSITSWTGGGLHAETDPASELPPNCVTIMKIDGGTWTREHPPLGGTDDDGDGFHCFEPGRAEIDVDHGDETLGVDPSRPN